MARILFTLLSFLIIIQKSFGAGLVFKNSEDNTYLIKSHIVFYGTEAREPYVSQIVKKMLSDLNQVRDDRSKIKVNFQLGHEIAQDNNELLLRIANNQSPYFQFIRLEKNTSLKISSNLLCSNVVIWLTKDYLNITTTAAHEYGHGLCLDHPSRLDFRGRGIPPLMAPRGSIVDSNFARSDVNDGFDSLDPIKRKLSNYEIKELGLDKLEYSKIFETFFEIAKIGKIDRIYYKKDGTAVRYFPTTKNEGPILNWALRNRIN